MRMILCSIVLVSSVLVVSGDTNWPVYGSDSGGSKVLTTQDYSSGQRHQP